MIKPMNMSTLSRGSLVIALLFAALVISMPSCRNAEKPAPEEAVTVHDTVSDELERLNLQISNSPADFKAYLARAIYYAKKSMENEALADVNKAISLDEANPEAYGGLSDVYMYLGKMQRALDALKKAKEMAPGAGIYDIKMARLYLTMSDYKQTFNALREGLSKSPDLAEAFFIGGLANEEMGDTIKAIDNYQMAVAKDPDYYDALKQLGIIMAERNNKLAIDYLRNAARVRPDNPEPLYVLGLYYQDHDEPDKALSVYEEILLIDSNYKLAHYNKGYVLMVYKDDYEGAAEAFSRAIELDPAYTDAWYNRGYAYELMGKREEAARDYGTVLKMHVNDEKAIAGLNRLDAMAR